MCKLDLIASSKAASVHKCENVEREREKRKVDENKEEKQTTREEMVGAILRSEECISENGSVAFFFFFGAVMYAFPIAAILDCVTFKPCSGC